MTGDDRLSAYLDDELSVDERQRLETELDARPELRAELDVARHSRALVRGLDPVDPPSEFDWRAPDDRLAPVVPLRTRRRWVLGVAAAVVFFVVLGFAAGTPVVEVVPPIDSLVDQHAAASEAMPDEVVTGSFEPMPMDDMDDMGPAMPDMPMVAAYQFDSITHFLYDSPHGPVSVFRQEGQLDATGLPGTESLTLESGTAMMMSDDEADVVIVERDDVVFTVVGTPASHDAVMDMASAVPATDWGMVDDVRRWLGRVS